MASIGPISLDDVHRLLVEVVGRHELLHGRLLVEVEVLTVDPSTGSATAIGPTGLGDVFGLGYYSGTLLAFTAANEIARLDPMTGAATVLATTVDTYWGAGVSPLVSAGCGPCAAPTRWFAKRPRERSWVSCNIPRDQPVRTTGQAATLGLLALCVLAFTPACDTCPAASACGQSCCATGSLCISDAMGNKTCGTPCANSGQCSGSTPCCAPVYGGAVDAGNFCQTTCGGQCCDISTSECVLTDDAGNSGCATLCTDSSQCTGSANCCTPTARCTSAADCHSVCLPYLPGYACRCNSASHCQSGCCAPATDPSGNPSGPYICRKTDGTNHDCCDGTTACRDNHGCCATDANRSIICIVQCTSDSSCGAGHCDNYPETPSGSTCTGSPPMGCGP
jgi:hypothetical protein